MKKSLALIALFTVSTAFAVLPPVAAEASTSTATATSSQIMAKVVESDPWGLGGADVNAKAVVTEKAGKTRSLVFEAKSRRYAPQLGKSIIQFQAPADVAGMKFLQIQNANTDDDRFLYMPELKRARRVAGSNRADSFMGTDFSYADLDGRDLRNSSSVLLGEEKIGKFDCFHLAATPKNGDAIYSKIELWVRKDNYVPMKWIMFDKKAQPVKTLVSREIQRHGGQWFITGSRMTDNVTGRTTELLLEKIERRSDLPADEFTVRTMEKG